MAIFVMLTSLTDEGRKQLKNNPGHLMKYNKVLEALGVHVVGQYALFGQYDLLEMLECKSSETLAKAGLGLADDKIERTLVLQGMRLQELLEPRMS